jgi:c-di-GMP-binding flagellar brake protein YcgR
MTSARDSSDAADGTPGFHERRKHQRRRAPTDLLLTISTVVNAEILDISAGGALVSTSAQETPGHRCQLRGLLDREPFSALVEVLRVAEGTRAGTEQKYHLGLRFGALDEHSRRTLQRFVRDGKPR